jgi:hypothetical protein
MKSKINITLFLALCALIFTFQSCEATAEGDTAELEGTESENLDPASTYACTITQSDFAKWFETGAITDGGMVDAANSLNELNSDCDAYKWSWQMFLWATSPTGTGNGDIVFNSDSFFDLLEDGTLVQEGGKMTRTMARTGNFKRTAQAGLGNFVFMCDSSKLTPEGAILYYAIHVNDVYAYFNTGKQMGEFTDMDQFPTTQKELTQIVKYAEDNFEAKILDSLALTMELKTSWVKIDPNAADAKSYITMKSEIPKYTKVTDQQLLWDGTSFEKATMALVGMHVTGSTFGHPEMIWATFEHKGNVPMANYQYYDSGDNLVSQTNFDDNGYLTGDAATTNWLFFGKDANMVQANDPRMSVDANGNITAEARKTIGATQVYLTQPFGEAMNNPNAKTNTAIRTINEYITSLLAEGDVRKNYIMIGATWTSNGVPGLPDGPAAIVEGSQQLANSSMETFFQKDNCFSCHYGGKLEGLSHIWSKMGKLTEPTTKTTPY